MSELTPTQVVSASFKTVRKGYDPEEVDEAEADSGAGAGAGGGGAVHWRVSEEPPPGLEGRGAAAGHLRDTHP